MAVGDDATGAGFPLVPSTGEEGRVRYGSREINRTRDFVAQVKTAGTAADTTIRTDLTPRIAKLESDLAALQGVVAVMRAILKI